MRPLNEITLEIAKFHEVLNGWGGDVQLAAQEMGMTEEQFIAAYDALAFEDAAKIDAYIYQIEQSRAKEAAAQAMVDQWKERLKTWEAQVKDQQKTQEFMKARLKVNMQAKGETRIETGEGRIISIQKNGGKPPLVIDEEKLSSIPDSEMRELEAMGVFVFQPMLEKSHLFDLLRAGTQFEWARIGEVGTHIRIK